MDGISPANQLLGGRYRLGALIAVGGMSTVHGAWDLPMHRAVAVKLYAPSHDPAAQRRFRVEAKTLAGLSHPGLVAVYDAGADEEQPYLVLQLIDGPTLREHIADGGPLRPREVRRIGARLAQTLAYVHSRGVIHRDVKPSNVLLDANSAPYLADFGISRLVDGARVTGSGQFVGTAGYLAPEQVRGTDAGRAVDVYALGLVLLECLTGHAEYTGSDVEAAVARLSRAPRIPEGTPADLAILIAAMTAPDPEDRPTAAQCAAALAGPDTAETAAVLDARQATTRGRLGCPLVRELDSSRVRSCADPAPVELTDRSRRWRGPTDRSRRWRRLRERGVLAAAAGITAVAAVLGWTQVGGTQPAGPGPVDAPSLVGAVPARQAAPTLPAAAEPPVQAVQGQPADDGRSSRDGSNGKGKGKKSGRG